MKRTRISDKIEYIEPSSMSNFKSCAGVMVSSSSGKIIIDTNMGTEETREFLQTEQPDIAVISHYHLDHCTWGPLVLEHTDAELFIPEGEEEYLSSLDFFIEKTAAPYGLIQEWREFSLGVTRYREIDHFSVYQDGSRFSTAGVTIECIRTPGHSPSHTAFYFPREKILFTGDMGIDQFGPWYGWTDCDLKQLIGSVLKLRSLNAETLLTSHGGIVASDIEGVWDNGLRQIMKREQNIRKRLDMGKSKTEIVEEGIFFQNKSTVREPVRSFLFMWDSIMFDHHRTLLEEGGLGKFFPEFSQLPANLNREQSSHR